MERLYNRDKQYDCRNNLETTIEYKFYKALEDIFNEYSYIEPYDLLSACIEEATVAAARASIRLKERLNNE